MRRKVAIMVGRLSDGGMERVAAQLSEMFSDSNFDVYILVGSFDEKNAYRHKGKLIVFSYALLNALGKPIKEVGALLYDIHRLTKLKKKYRINFTISCAPEMNLLNMLSGRKDKKILTVHSCLSVRKDFVGLCYRKMIIKIYNYSYKVIAVSKWCRQDLIKHYGIRDNKIEVIYNPVSIEAVRNNIVLKENIVLIVGRLHDVKQQWHIIRAFRNVLNEVEDAKLVIAGTGENRRYLKELSKQMKIEDHVYFMGFVNDMGELYRQAKVVIFSSASEAFPCSVIEAISNGVPVIAADCPGGIREIIARDDPCDEVIKTYTFVKCGVLVPRLDGKKYKADHPLTKAEIEMSKAIIHLLQNEDIRKDLVRNCLIVSREFDEKKIKKQWCALLR